MTPPILRSPARFLNPLFKGLAAPRSVALALGGMAIALTACQPPPVSMVKETEHAVASYVVSEQIYKRPAANWLLDDDYYQRIYTIEANGQDVATLKQDNDWYMYPESVEFLNAPPKMVDDWLVLVSHTSVWIWKPDQEAILFNPFHHATWSYEGDTEPAHLKEPLEENRGIKGTWGGDYLAHDFTIVDGKWMLEYRSSGHNKPDSYTFVSEDKGETFYLLDS